MIHLVLLPFLLSAAYGNIGRTVWALCNTLDTLRSLKEVRSNGRKVGITTRRKLIKQCLVGWIVFVVAQPVGLLADATLFWFPFYKSLKSVVIMILIIWRLETSGMLFETFIAPTLKRHETHIDLTIALLHAVFEVTAHVLLYLPWALIRPLLEKLGVVTPPNLEAPSPVTKPSPAKDLKRQDAKTSKNAKGPKDPKEPPVHDPEVAIGTRKRGVRVSAAVSDRKKAFEEGSKLNERKTATIPRTESATAISSTSAPKPRRAPKPGSTIEARTAQLIASLPTPPNVDPDRPGPGPGSGRGAGAGAGTRTGSATGIEFETTARPATSTATRTEAGSAAAAAGRAPRAPRVPARTPKYPDLGKTNPDLGKAKYPDSSKEVKYPDLSAFGKRPHGDDDDGPPSKRTASGTRMPSSTRIPSTSGSTRIPSTSGTSRAPRGTTKTRRVVSGEKRPAEPAESAHPKRTRGARDEAAPEPVNTRRSKRRE